MNENKNNRGWRILRRLLIGAAVFATLIAIFYTEENWRGKRTWENCQSELEAQGVVLDWKQFIPPPVPDDQNFFKAPNMQHWFVKSSELSDHQTTTPNPTALDALSSNAMTTVMIISETAAADYLKWSDQFQPSFDLIREALKRPYASMDGDYSGQFQIPVPNFVQIRRLAQVLAQRTKCCLLLGKPDQALHELTLLTDSRKLLESAPTGKPMTLVASMINVALSGLYAETVAYGLQSHFWRESQLTALEAQLQAINLPPFLVESFKEERIYSAHLIETSSPVALAELATGHAPKNLWQKLHDSNYLLVKVFPRGWVYQNMAFAIMMGQKWNEGFDLANNRVQPQAVDRNSSEITAGLARWSPWNIWSRLAAPNFRKAIQLAARNQTFVNENLIACALERYQLAQGSYPETLDKLVPQFINELPHDIIGGGELKYRRTADGKFLLYSVGWNETDDGGKVVLTKNGTVDRDQGDWVWQYPSK